jgi:transcription-repair coupling factor (superfamily II helicase)
MRGGIIDIYPLIGTPVRIELFDTEVDSIRDFDVETQRSNDNINQVEITTASDYIITDEVIQHSILTGVPINGYISMIPPRNENSPICDTTLSRR